MEEVPQHNFADIVDSHLKTTADEAPREPIQNMQLSLSCEKITEADQEDCSLIVDDNQNATPNSSGGGPRNLHQNSTSAKKQNADLERRKSRQRTESMSKAREPARAAPSSEEPLSQMS